MTETQKILFEQALYQLKGIEEKVDVLQRKILFPADSKYENWAIVGDEVTKDLRQCAYFFQTILNEVKDK